MPRQRHLGRRDPSLQTCHHATVYEIKVVEANPSVMAHTIIPNLHASDGSSTSGGDGAEDAVAHGADAPLLTLLVSAGGAAGNFALLAVDRTTNRVDGMAKTAGGDLVEVHQLPGEATVVTAAEEQDPHRDWECGVEDSSTDGDPLMAGANPDGGDRARRCVAGGCGNDHYHKHPPRTSSPPSSPSTECR